MTRREARAVLCRAELYALVTEPTYADLCWHLAIITRWSALKHDLFKFARQANARIVTPSTDTPRETR